MKLLKEISYTDIFQRKIIYINSFITYFVITYVFVHYSQLLYSLNIYTTTLTYFSITAAFALLLGNAFGRFLFNTSKSRSLYILTETFFVILSLFIILIKLEGAYRGGGIYDTIINDHRFLISFFAFLLFLAGLKSHYFLKLSCGSFIDDRKAAIPFISAIMIGVISGILVSSAFTFFPRYDYLVSLILIPILPFIFLLRLPYFLIPQYAQETGDQEEKKNDESGNRDDIYFAFLNFSCIIVYIFLGYKTIIKEYGNLLHVQILFVVLTAGSLLVGFLIARFIKTAFWFIYSEMLFPLVFLIFLALFFYNDITTITYGRIAFLLIPFIVFGFSFYKTLTIVLSGYDHNRRFEIINYSLFILPIPIVIALLLVEFTNIWFFVFLYIIVTINILLPGIHLLQSSINPYKKAIYFLFTLIFIPQVFIIHKYLDLPFTNELFVQHVTNFQLLYNNKYNSLYVQNNSDVYYHDYIIFQNNDSAIRNLNRILIPVYLYADADSGGKKTLFIDGNQKFYRTKSISYFKNIDVIDYVPERMVDYHTLPLGGSYGYIADKTGIPELLNSQNRKYDIIVDVPNMLDQSLYFYRYSERYYGKLKNILNPGGIVAQVINMSHISKELTSLAYKGFNNHFEKSIGFQCADYLIIMGSNDKNAFDINENNLKTLGDLFKRNPEMIFLYYNEFHMLSHCLFSDIDLIQNDIQKTQINICGIFSKKRVLEDNLKIFDRYIDSGEEAIKLFSEKIENAVFKRKSVSELLKNSEMFRQLKIADIAGVERDFEKEAETLNYVGKNFGYGKDIGKYIQQVMSLKQEFYFNTALELEKGKKWDDAIKLYSAILKINNNDFDANYRMGLLHITLQNMNDAFNYMKQAMKLKNDDPRVQFQMGVLMFSSGRASDALKYLERSMDLKNDNPSLYLYIGFCHEEMGKIYDAKQYYQKAFLMDPNDGNIKLSLDRINIKIQEEMDKWKSKDPKNQNEDEQGEKIPLPINKSAYEYRITDDEATKLKDK